ncbi:MAG: acyltransferase [Nitrospirae bacterium]|nr:MAG: acyltransferase [Nitrospirota bacterium]
MIVGLIQMACQRDPQHNMDHAVSMVETAARQGAHLICLPELFRSRYFCQSENPAWFDLAESLPGPSTNVFGEIAKRYRVAIVVPIFERRAPGLYHNTVAVLNESGAIAGVYRKMHIPDDPGYYEKFYFTPGDLGFQAVETQQAMVGPLICWDQWFPEAARLTALQGADILVYPTAIGWHPSEKSQERARQREAWMTVQRAHAIANGVFVAAVNRVGVETLDDDQSSSLEFWGSSFVCDPFGQMLGQCSDEKTETLLVDLDLRRIEIVRRHWPFMRDRRIDAYDGLTRRWLDHRSSH